MKWVPRGNLLHFLRYLLTILKSKLSSSLTHLFLFLSFSHDFFSFLSLLPWSIMSVSPISLFHSHFSLSPSPPLSFFLSPSLLFSLPLSSPALLSSSFLSLSLSVYSICAFFPILYLFLYSFLLITFHFFSIFSCLLFPYNINLHVYISFNIVILSPVTIHTLSVSTIPLFYCLLVFLTIFLFYPSFLPLSLLSPSLPII